MAKLSSRTKNIGMWILASAVLVCPLWNEKPAKRNAQKWNKYIIYRKVYYVPKLLRGGGVSWHKKLYFSEEVKVLKRLCRLLFIMSFILFRITSCTCYSSGNRGEAKNADKRKQYRMQECNHKIQNVNINRNLNSCS